MEGKFTNNHNGVNQPVETVAICTKIRIPNLFTPVLDGLLVRVRKDCLPRLLYLRECSSSKYYPEIPCVVAKSMGGTQDSVSLSGAVLVTPSLEVPAYA